MVTIRETERPSKSQVAGPCYIRIESPAGPVYAQPTERHIYVPVGPAFFVTAEATLRHATRIAIERASWTLVATGDPEDVVVLSVGHPRAITAELTGARLIVVGHAQRVERGARG